MNLSKSVAAASNRHGFNFHPGLGAQDSEDVEKRIRAAMHHYLVDVLGRNEKNARKLIQMELQRSIPKTAIAYLAAEGVSIQGARVLDVGAGLGGLTAELAARGAIVTAVEPGALWRSIVSARVHPAAHVAVIGAIGEQLPFRPDSFDLVISLQVLEHVHDPQRVIAEVFRVLRPGGHFYLTCENYLSFREPHYSVFWLPLLPKRIGAWYLQLRGRRPDFLLSAVTYTTIPSVLRALRTAGFYSQRDERAIALIHSPGRIRTAWKRRAVTLALAFAPVNTAVRVARFYDLCRRLFTFVIYELVRKPPSVQKAYGGQNGENQFGGTEVRVP